MKTIISAIFVLFILSSEIFACTTFIISGKYTQDGRPILFKNRDTDEMNNGLVLFTDGKYRYIGLVDGNENNGTMVWGGYNETGFAIINSAAYNNNTGDTSSLVDREGIVMKMALQSCRTLKDFEDMLNSMPKPLGVDANFGVIDAYGGAAYYETGNYDFKRYNADDPAVCANGVLVRTNHSMRGELEKGFGFCRFRTATDALTKAAVQKKLTPQFLFSITSRNLTHSLTKTDLMKNLPPNDLQPDYRFFIDYIPRNSTASVVMIVGANNEKKAGETMMWTILGFPLTSVALPVWITEDGTLPRAVTLNQDLRAPLCSAALKLKGKCFPITYDRGYNYINFAAVANRKNTGIMQLLQPVEKEIFKRGNAVAGSMAKGNKSDKDIKEFYGWIDQYLESSYKKIFAIDLGI